MKLRISTIAGLALLAGCSTTKTQLSPGTGGDYQIAASGETESSAYAAAIDAATLHCRKLGRSFRVLEERSEFQGGSRDLKEEGKVTLSFKCV